MKLKLASFEKLKRIYTGFGILTALLFTIGFVIKIIQSGEWIQKFPFEIWFPFNEYDPKNYGFAFLWMFTISLSQWIFMEGTDLLLYGFISLVEIQYDFLCLRIKELITSQQPAKELKKIVGHHNEIIDIVKDLEKIFSPSIFANFIGTSILMCTIGFQLVASDNPMDVIGFCGSLSCFATQGFLLFYFGNKLVEGSLKVSDAIYQSGWNELNNNQIKHAVLLITMKSQKPPVLTALKFTTICLKVFVSVSL